MEKTLKETAAWYAQKKGAPLTQAYDMTAKQKALTECVRPDPEWQEGLNQKWWGHANLGKDSAEGRQVCVKAGVDTRFWDLHVRLVGLAGFETCFAYGDEPDMENILAYGQLWVPEHVVKRAGAPSDCHANSARIWAAEHGSKDITIATGYALSKEGGMWRQHTWLVRRGQRKVSILETTVPRIAYFGYALTETECQKFCEHNR